MYYPDLTLYCRVSDQSQIDQQVLNVGWLDSAHPPVRGEASAQFTERLWRFCHYKVNPIYGIHRCAFCRDMTWYYPARRGPDKVHLGSSEIRVLGHNGTVYAAPDLIYHYVVDHQYRPPEAFIRAVLEGPLPDTQEYQQRALWQVFCVGK